MPSKILKLYLSSLILFITFSSFNVANAQSVDPFGDIYITKTPGDLSNCGPIAALMLSKFSKRGALSKDLASNIQYARRSIQKNPNSNRWWRISDITKYFAQEGIKHRLISTQNKNTIKNQLDQNSAVIINVNMNNLSRGKNIGKPYFTFPFPGGWGHFLVIVGYKQMGGKLMYEVHDSYIKGGNNRLYDADEIQFALQRYNPKILVVQR